MHELLPGDVAAQRVVWGHTAMAWAPLQAVAAHVDSRRFAQTGRYRLLFVLGRCAWVLALATDLLAGYSAAAKAASGSSAT